MTEGKTQARQEIRDEVAHAFQQLARDVVKQAVIEALKEQPSTCCPANCKERCGITPSEHYEAHRKMAQFFSDLQDTSRAIRSTLVKVIVTVLIVAAALGLGIKIEKFF